MNLTAARPPATCGGRRRERPAPPPPCGPPPSRQAPPRAPPPAQGGTTSRRPEPQHRPQAPRPQRPPPQGRGHTPSPRPGALLSAEPRESRKRVWLRESSALRTPPISLFGGFQTLEARKGVRAVRGVGLWDYNSQHAVLCEAAKARRQSVLGDCFSVSKSQFCFLCLKTWFC